MNDVEMVRGARRILFYGVTGSGKSSAAVRLGHLLGYPTHLVDEEIGWLPGWIERDRGEQAEIARQIAAEDTWVLDSAYSHWRDIILDRTDLIIALDYPRLTSLSRLITRSLHRVTTKTPVCNGNTETWRQLLSSDSIIVWHGRSFARKRQRMTEMSATHPMIRLTHPRQFEELMFDLASTQSRR